MQVWPVRLGTASELAAIQQVNQVPGLPRVTEISDQQGDRVSTVTFHNVSADSDEQAIQLIHDRMKIVLPAMSIDQEGAPESFQYHVISEQSDTLYHVSENAPSRVWIPVAHSSKIGALLSAIDRSNIADADIELLIQLYHSTKLERVPQYRLFKAWQVMELAARRVDLTEIRPTQLEIEASTSPAGNPLKSLRKVIVYFRKHVDTTCTPWLTENLNEKLYCAFTLRNYVAHEGAVPSLSTCKTKGEEKVLKFYENGLGSFEVMDLARLAVITEVNATS